MSLQDTRTGSHRRCPGSTPKSLTPGLHDNPVKAVEAAENLKKEEISLLFVFISTYALSSTVLPLAQRVKVPVILLNIQPVAAIDYEYINGLGDRGKMTGEWAGTLPGLFRT